MAIVMIKRGMSRRLVAEAFKVTTRSSRNWVVRCNAEGPDGLADKPRSGRPPRLGAAERDMLTSWVEADPDPQVAGVCRWWIADLRGKLEATCGVSVGREALRSTSHAMGCSHISPRPLHQVRFSYGVVFACLFFCCFYRVRLLGYLRGESRLDFTELGCFATVVHGSIM